MVFCGTTNRLRFAAAVQDALLLSMIKGAADCDTVPDNASSIVAKVQEQGGRLIRRVRLANRYA